MVMLYTSVQGREVGPGTRKGCHYMSLNPTVIVESGTPCGCQAVYHSSGNNGRVSLPVGSAGNGLRRRALNQLKR